MKLNEKNEALLNKNSANSNKNGADLSKENKKKAKNAAKAAKAENKKAARADKNKIGPSIEEEAATLGKSRSFAMAEAHKRLRTNIMFSFADDSECHIIGVTSAMAHEGKTTTSINLAYDLMKAGKKALLIDADMRMSRIPKLLSVEAAPGLSNMLVGKNGNQNVIRTSENHDGLQLITCGDIPPNPTELLSSKRFEMMLDVLKETYEYIVVDLPPVSEVSDAIIASKLVDGMIVVVRQDYVDKRLLDDTIHQLNLSETRILGLVMTCAQYRTKYGKYKYKKGSGSGYKYGYRGGYGYGKRSGYYSRNGHNYYSHYGYGYSQSNHHSHESHVNNKDK